MEMPIVYEVSKNVGNQEIKLYTEWYFYGKEANEILAAQIAADAENAWNEANAEIIVEGRNYKVIFEMKGFFIPDLKERTVTENQYPWRKFFKIVPTNSLSISFVDGLFGNSGQFVLKNIQKKDSKTAAHELGHMWGLEHPEETDYRGKGRPHIMLPRGSFVDPEFRYKPEAELYKTPKGWMMEEGFTVDTDKRSVQQLNVDDLQLEELEYNKNGFANLSKLSNKFYP